MNLLGRVVLAAAENIRLGAFSVAQLVYLGLELLAGPQIAIGPTHHGTVCNKSNQRVWREQAQAHDDRVLEGLQAVLLLACVDDKNEDGKNGRACRSTGNAVFDGGV